MRRLLSTIGLADVLALTAALAFGATVAPATAQTTPLPMSATPAPAPTPAGQRPMSMGASHADDRGATSLPVCPPSDPMVWLDTKHRLYYTSSQDGRPPKRTKRGHYACTSGAVATGAAAATPTK